MNALTLIGLTGLAGAGKDTVRQILESQHGFIGFGFADPIRNMLRTLLSDNGISESWMDERALKEQQIPTLGKSYRELAQTLGTEWGRTVLGQDFWLRIAESYLYDIASTTFGPQHFVISDVRFQNEADWVRQRGGVIWHINRPGLSGVRDHISEQGAGTINPDRTLINDGSIDDLAVLVGSIIDRACQP